MNKKCFYGLTVYLDKKKDIWISDKQIEEMMCYNTRLSAKRLADNLQKKIFIKAKKFVLEKYNLTLYRAEYVILMLANSRKVEKYDFILNIIKVLESYNLRRI